MDSRHFFLVRSVLYLLASLANGHLRNNLKLPKKDHVFVTMESEHASPSPERKMRLDSRHQDPTAVELYVLPVDSNRDWEPDTAFWRTVRAGFTFDKVQVSAGHISRLITATGTVRPK